MSCAEGEPAAAGGPERRTDTHGVCGAEAGSAAGACLQVVVERRARSAPAPSPAHPHLCAECGAGDASDARPSAPSHTAPPEEAASVEVYVFERGGGALTVSGGGGPPARLERAAAGLGRGARAFAAEGEAALRLAAAAPLHAALGALRAALRVARDAAAGLVHAASDYGLKPALAVAHNALVHPVLVFTGAVLGGALDALRPALALVDALAESLARVLAACAPFHRTPAPRA